MAMMIILAIIIIDQCLKIWVKTNFFLGEDYPITSWFHLKFIENNGMAFGLELWDKLVLTIGRIIAVILFIIFIIKIKDNKQLRTGFLISIALITAGAAGNIFDCIFYGKIFNSPYGFELATFMPHDGGYANWFEGKVVDMLYFPLFSFDLPNWIPIIGGKNYEFFQYIFNIADSAICIGVFLLIFFYSKDVNDAIQSLKSNKTDSDKIIDINK